MAARTKAILKSRTVWLFAIFVVLYLAVGWRLFFVQVKQSDTYVQWAKRFRFRHIPVEATRGNIYDRNGRVLAVNLETISVFADTREIKDKNKTAVKIASIIGVNPQKIEGQLNGRRTFVWLGRQLDPRISKKIKGNPDLLGIGTQKDTKRVYPMGTLAAQVLGFTDIDSKGVEGLEHIDNNLLKGTNGLINADLDSKRRVIPETRKVIRERVNGKSIYLTIDTTIQHICEKALANMAKIYKPDHASAIVMDPRTGEILAIANYPSYNANQARNVDPKLWRNRAVADLYEPGSTLKVLTVAGAINEGYSPNTIFAKCTGKEKIKGGSIPCVLHKPYLNGHGAVDMNMIIRYSCNIGAAHVAIRLGSENLYKYQKEFGLLKKIHAGFGCESVGWTTKPDKWKLIELANKGFGQGIAINPLQMACLYSTVANGGVYVSPQVIREIKGPDGKTIKSFKIGSKHRVISEQTALAVTKLMESCVKDGTGKTAQIEGRSVAGKTGSAQVAKTNGRGYEPGVFVASFMGFAPSRSARLVITVVVNRPKGSHWGASVAAPVFKEIGEKSLWYLKVPSSQPIEKKTSKPDVALRGWGTEVRG